MAIALRIRYALSCTRLSQVQLVFQFKPDHETEAELGLYQPNLTGIRAVSLELASTLAVGWSLAQWDDYLAILDASENSSGMPRYLPTRSPLSPYPRSAISLPRLHYPTPQLRCFPTRIPLFLYPHSAIAITESRYFPTRIPLFPYPSSAICLSELRHVAMRCALWYGATSTPHPGSVAAHPLSPPSPLPLRLPGLPLSPSSSPPYHAESSTEIDSRVYAHAPRSLVLRAAVCYPESGTESAI
eukprot:3813165-Rhodomonas_salina.2